MKRICSAGLLVLVCVSQLIHAGQAPEPDTMEWHDMPLVQAPLYITPERVAACVEQLRNDKKMQQLRLYSAGGVCIASVLAVAYYTLKQFSQVECSVDARIQQLEQVVHRLQPEQGNVQVSRFGMMRLHALHFFTYAIPTALSQLAMSKSLGLLGICLRPWSVAMVIDDMHLPQTVERLMLYAAQLDQHIRFVASVQGYQFRGFQAFVGDYCSVAYDVLSPYLVAAVVRAGGPVPATQLQPYQTMLIAQVKKLGDELTYLIAACQDNHDYQVQAQLAQLAAVHAEFYTMVQSLAVSAQHVHAFCVHIQMLCTTLKALLHPD